MNFTVIEDLKKHLLSSYPDSLPKPGWDITPEICPAEMNGDITVNCFRFAGIFRVKPTEMAQVVLDFVSSHPDVIEAEVIKAFVNILLKPEAICRVSVADVGQLVASAQLREEDRKRILIEFSAPNTNKPQHLGHVRNNAIGMSLCKILQKTGHEVIPVNLVNDRGIHICKSMLAYQRFGNGITPESCGKKGDHLVGDFYVRFNDELQSQLADLRRNRPEFAAKTDEELFPETEIGNAAQEMLRAWEQGDPEVKELWQMMNNWVFSGFAETYKRMGVEFSHTYLESETYLLGKDIIAAGLDKGVFSKREDGAVVVDLGKKLGQKVVLRSDGTSVYITQDIGTTIRKHDDFQADRQIWVVGDEQLLHFRQLFAIMAKLGYDWAKGLYHLAYGMVNLPTGKMKSREGTVVDADDLFDEMHKLAKAATLERCGENIPPDLEERAEAIGMGALKFMLLKFNAKSTIMFDPGASVKFEGDTGPYVQYACARINSIQRKAADKGIEVTNLDPDWSISGTKEEKNLAIRAFQYPGMLRLAAEKMDSSVLAGYLLDLARDFSRFYRECPVLNAENDKFRRTRLAMCLAVRDIIADGLKALTIKVPEEM